MKTFEARGKIKDIKDARNVAEKIGGIFKGYYHAVDVILKPKEEDREGGIIDLRIFDINNRQTKIYTITQKIAEWSGNTKKDKIIIKREFDEFEKVLNFIKDHYGNILDYHYEYARDGWEYHLENGDIFIEYIENLGPTIEIEAENKSDVETLFKFFEVREYFYEPVPEIMRKLLKR